jgi:hypothetical protein
VNVVLLNLCRRIKNGCCEETSDQYSKIVYGNLSFGIDFIVQQKVYEKNGCKK